ncbi:hypothetical protein BU26DRAFT_409807, partial [Trematosphaeria pertusa]
SCTTASCPFRAAHDNGVRPSQSPSMVLAPFLRRSCTTASCPFRAAHDNGVRPASSFESASSLWKPKTSLSIASCPPAAAKCNTDKPFSDCTVTS